jgi:hypothetical protein
MKYVEKWERVLLHQEKFEDAKGVIRSSKSKKDRQTIQCQKKKTDNTMAKEKDRQYNEQKKKTDNTMNKRKRQTIQ